MRRKLAAADQHRRGQASRAGKGRKRQQRIEEFLEENDVPVLGLREG